MARKTFLIFWLLSLIPIIILGSWFTYAVETGIENNVVSSTLVLIVTIAAASMALIFWLVARRIFAPLQKTAQTARQLARKQDGSVTDITLQDRKSPAWDEASVIAQSLEQIADNLHETENRLQIQAAAYQGNMLALTQFADEALANAEDNAAFDAAMKLVLELAIKHLGYAYSAFFVQESELPGAEETRQADAQQSVHISLHKVAEAGAEHADNSKLCGELLQKAFDTGKRQIQSTTPQTSAHALKSATDVQMANLTDLALPLYHNGQIRGILYASHTSLQGVPGAAGTTQRQNTHPENLITPLAELQILAALTGLVGAPYRADKISYDAAEKEILAAEKIASGPDGLDAATVQRRLAEFESLWKISQAISAETDIIPLYNLIHEQLTQIMGELSSFAIVLYTQEKEQLQIPYMIEDGQMVSVPPFPLGQGLSSIVIRSGEPLLLAHSTAERARNLGAIFVGEPAKSWLGVPLTLGGEVFGLIIVQDTHHEERFDEEDQRLLSLIASQVAVVVRNARLLEASRRQTQTQSQLIDISDKIRRSVELQTILKTTAGELARALDAQQAAIRLYSFNSAQDMSITEANQMEDGS